MLVTGHWAVVNPNNGPIGDYNVQYGKKDGAFTREAILAMGKVTDPSKIDWDALKNGFNVYKVMPLDQAPTYATWHINHDPRDNSADCAIGALCMTGATTSNFGDYPFDYSYAWMMAGIMARIAYLKGIDTNGSFPDSVEPSVLQNGPIFNLSIHAERALQTVDSGDSVPKLGYFIYSGDSDCRWDLCVLDESESGDLATVDGAVAACYRSARWLRGMAHIIKGTLNEKSDMWGLEK